jgi:hypothetical protein
MVPAMLCNPFHYLEYSTVCIGDVDGIGINGITKPLI